MAQISRKSFGYGAAVSVVIGSIIGSGIFMKPAAMASQVASPTWLIIVWVIAGLFSLFGALIYAEVGSMIPENGGNYVYFRHMYGDFTAFLYGWAAFTAINTASVSAIAFVCAAYANFFLDLPRFPTEVENDFLLHIPFLGNFYPLANFGVKSLAIFLIIVLTVLNYISTRGSSVFPGNQHRFKSFCNLGTDFWYFIFRRWRNSKSCYPFSESKRRMATFRRICSSTHRGIYGI